MSQSAAIKHDPVSNPAHYKTKNGLEAIDVIESSFGSSGHLPTAVKYILRAGKKDAAPAGLCLAKARWYINRVLDADTLPPIARGHANDAYYIDIQDIASSFGLSDDLTNALECIEASNISSDHNCDGRRRDLLSQADDMIAREIDALK